jgi:hypothetical protein
MLFTICNVLCYAYTIHYTIHYIPYTILYIICYMQHTTYNIFFLANRRSRGASSLSHWPLYLHSPTALGPVALFRAEQSIYDSSLVEAPFLTQQEARPTQRESSKPEERSNTFKGQSRFRLQGALGPQTRGAALLPGVHGITQFHPGEHIQ